MADNATATSLAKDGSTPQPTQQPKGKKLSKAEKRELRLKQQEALKAQKAQGSTQTQNTPSATDGTQKGQVLQSGQGSQKGQPGSEGPQKSKAELKAERRIKQEAQRAAKLASKGGTEGGTGLGLQGVATKPRTDSFAKKERPRVSDDILLDDPSVQKRRAKKLEKQQVPKRPESVKKVKLFAHLDQFERQVSLTKGLSFAAGGIHPAIINLGLQYAEGNICGANARCIAMLWAFKKVINDYTTPPHKELSRDLESKIKPYISFLNQCRPKSVSMGNAIKYLKMQISNIPSNMNDSQAKEELCESLDHYIKKNIVLAAEGISQTLINGRKIRDGDVIMIYGCSSVIQKILCDAHRKSIMFRVIVVDSRPKLEGREAVRRLITQGIKCSYVLINSISYMMPEVTKVFLGAHALLANGYIMSRVGSSLIAIVAKSQNVPVLVCCETYKFSDRAQTDSFVTNELGDPDDLVVSHRSAHHLQDWRTIDHLTILNLVYDVFPPEFVSMVITELGMIPCTSVPVVLRVKNVEG